MTCSLLFLDLVCRVCPLKRRCLDDELGIRRYAFRCPVSRLDALVYSFLWALWALARRLKAEWS
ncbi:MAG: hypothetical protein DRO09_00085 [Thermoprotei archaeon]|nr:MAG: hypothetical protein DRO09_00085 [Thermoprotei archaeon]